MTGTMTVRPRYRVLETRVPVTGARRTRRVRTGALLVTIGLAGFLATLVGGYAGRWTWTGYLANGTVWNWLQVMLLPLALSGLPMLWRDEPGDRRYVAVGLAMSGLALAVLVVGGYGWGWSWTGFAGNSLWDWLNLILLPLTVAVVPLWAKTRDTHPGEWFAGIAAPTAVLAVLLVGAYRFGWSWTGFAGNTLFDWIHLLVVPLVLPAVFLSVDRQQRELRALRGAGAGARATAAAAGATPSAAGCGPVSS